MSSILSTNMASLYAQRSLASAQTELAGSVQKLSSGRQINSAKDNAAGLGISEGVMGVRNISDQSIRNLQSATSLVQTADGALDVVGKILQRALTLTTQKDNVTLNDAQLGVIDNEIASLISEIGRIKDRTRFNSAATIFGETYSFGAGSGVTTTFTIPDLGVTALDLSRAARTAPVEGVTLEKLALGAITLPNLVAASGFTRDHEEIGVVAPAENPISVSDFSELGSVVTTNFFNIAGHGFADGNEIIYRKGLGNLIDPLVDGRNYFVKNVQGDTFQLSDTLDGQVINFTGLGSSIDASFLKATIPALSLSITSIATTETTTTTLLVDQTWQDGKKVYFSAGTATATGGLEDGKVYTISEATDNSITLLDDFDAPIEFSSDDNLNGSSLTYLGLDDKFRVTSTDPFHIRFTDHGFSGGEKFFYSGITRLNLVQDTIYYVSTIPTGVDDEVEKDIFRLATTEAGAVARTPEALVPIGNGTLIGDFYWASLTGSPINDFESNPVLPANSFVLDDVGFEADDLVLYREGDAAINGLIDESLYFIKTANGNVIQLSSTEGGDVIPIGEFDDLTGASFQKVTKLEFNSGNPDSVVLNNTISSTGHGFEDDDIVFYHANSGTPIPPLDGRQYHVVNKTIDTFQLSETQGGPAISLTGSGNIDQTFTESTSVLTSVGHGLTNDQQVIYRANGDPSLAPLIDGQTYFVRDALGDNFSLSEELDGDPIVFTSSGNINQSFSPLTNVINSVGHGFSENDIVVYSFANDGEKIPELEDGGDYIVTNVEDDSFQLTEVGGDGTIISFTGTGAGDQRFTRGTGVITSTGHGFSENDNVVYSVAAGETAISPLISDRHYIVKNVENDSFQLTEVGSNQIIAFDATGDGEFTSESVAISTTSLSNAIAINSSNRAELGARLNTLSYAIDNLQTLSNNLGEAYSRIVDTDYAAETAAFTRNQILQQAATSMLAQANQMPNVILTLLK
jgi:flagellin-like hook-associated protein FlgL